MSIFRPTDQEQAKDSRRVHIEDTLAPEKFSLQLCNTMTQFLPDRFVQEIVVMCIGTDRSTGDCLGPLVGSKLVENPLNMFTVLGTLDDPVHASNLAEKLESLYQKTRNPFIIAVDACLGRLDSVGFLCIGKGALRPGAGVNKNLPAVGQLHITGIVNVGGFMEYFVLQNTRLSLVMKMAKVISNSLITCGQAVIVSKNTPLNKQPLDLEKGSNSDYRR
ncbi:MAG: spore protease YyaC [Carboxydocellales bacterium]